MTTALPQLSDRVFLTDGGVETDLMFNHGHDLPCFASIVMVNTNSGRSALEAYYRPYLELAGRLGHGFILESPTWRASSDWAGPLGYDCESLDRANEAAIELMRSLREAYAAGGNPIVVSGCVGPRGDGYQPTEMMTADEAQSYHHRQLGCFARAGADMAAAVTMTYADEAIGIVRAAASHGLPVAVSFTTETDGRLPDGATLAEAIDRVDDATDHGPAYYMINCAHPDHFAGALDQGERWTNRIRGIRANASRMSHAELDEAEQLDDGDPREFGDLYRTLRDRFPQLTVLGGCCGTDHRHIQAVSNACGTQ